jgi:hypothetical protein
VFSLPGGAALASQPADAVAVSFPTQLPGAESSGEGGGERGEAQDVLGVGQVGEGDEYGAHAAVSQQPVAADVLVGGTRVVALGEGGGGGPAAQSLHDRCGVLTVAADDRDVEHGHLGLGWVAPGLQAVLAEDGKLAVQRAEVRGKIATAVSDITSQASPTCTATKIMRARAFTPAG